MEYQKQINLFDNTSNQPFKFRAKNWIEIDDESRRTYEEINQIRIKTAMLRSSLCNYIDVHIFLKGAITVTNTANSDNKKVILKNCMLFIKRISRMNKSIMPVILMQ